MIFYFTGTGNSLFAAKALADEGEEIISIIDALHSKAFQYTLADNEKLGFVFPVYFLIHNFNPRIEIANRRFKEVVDWRFAVLGKA